MTTHPATDPQTKAPLQIIRLSITNFGIIEAASILPDDSPVILAGDNGNGKSTVLNAIESVLYGAKLAEPVRHGQVKAEIKLDLGEPGSTTPVWQVEQIIKKDGDGKANYNLKIYDAERKQVPSPTTFIETLIGSGAALDPVAIMQPKPGERPETFAKRQAETLMDRLGLTAKAALLDESIQKVSADRKAAKDAAAAISAQLAAILVPRDTPDEPVDVSALASEMADYQDMLAQRERLNDKINEQQRAWAAATERHAKLARELEEATQAQNQAAQALMTSRNALHAFDEDTPQAGITEAMGRIKSALETATATNAAVASKAMRKELSAKLAQAEGREGALTAELEKLRADRLQIVRDAKLPVEGLELTAEALLYNGKPLIQESSGNRIRVCSLLAMAENPDCRVLFIREASLTNAANKQIIYDIAEERGFQVWVESFSETPLENALWIKAGEVSEGPKKAKKAAGAAKAPKFELK